MKPNSNKQNLTNTQSNKTKQSNIEARILKKNKIKRLKREKEYLAQQCKERERERGWSRVCLEFFSLGMVCVRIDAWKRWVQRNILERN